MSDPVPWQDTATAIGTVGAVVVALGLALVTEARTRADRRRDHETRAQRVSAWCLYEPVAAHARPGTYTIPGHVGLYVYVLNSGAEPVWGVEVSPPAGTVVYGDNAPQDGVARIDVVPPGQPVCIGMPWRLPDSPRGPRALSVEFRDGQGVRWRRDATGSLVRVE